MPGDPRQSEQLTGLLADAGRTGFRGRTPAAKKGETYQDRGKEMVELRRVLERPLLRQVLRPG